MVWCVAWVVMGWDYWVRVRGIVGQRAMPCPQLGTTGSSGVVDFARVVSFCAASKWNSALGLRTNPLRLGEVVGSRAGVCELRFRSRLRLWLWFVLAVLFGSVEQSEARKKKNQPWNPEPDPGIDMTSAMDQQWTRHGETNPQLAPSADQLSLITTTATHETWCWGEDGQALGRPFQGTEVEENSEGPSVLEGVAWVGMIMATWETFKWGCLS